MANSNKNKPAGLISQAFGVAKKLSTTGLDLLNHVAPGSVSKLDKVPSASSILDINTETAVAPTELTHTHQTKSEKNMSDKKSYENPQALFRSHVPKVTQQLLGRHFNKVNNVASFISPDINNKISDFFFDKLNGFVSEQSSVDHVLKEVGAKNLTELAGNPDRSNRIGAALANQNKTIAAVVGAVSGASGVIGSAIDIPLSLALTLKMIYQSGRAHGFELDHKSEQQVVEYVFREVDFGSIAEKQTLLVALRAFSNLLETQDTQQLQKMLGSSNDFNALKNWLSNSDGTLKWSWLNKVPQVSILAKLTPLAGAGIGAVYSWKLIDDANLKAQQIFSGAQHYLIQHPDEKIDLLTAYEKSIALTVQATPLLSAESEHNQIQKTEQSTTPVENEVIKKVEIKLKSEEPTVKAEPVEVGLQKLVDEYVEPVEEHTSQKSLADKGGDELIQALDEDDQEYPVESSSKGEVITETEPKSVKPEKVETQTKTAVKKRVTKATTPKASPKN